MRSPQHPRRTRLAAVALLTPFALGVAACGTDATDDPSTVEAGSPDAVVSATESTPSPSAPSGSTDASSAPPTATSLQDAAEAALAEVDGELFAIDQEDGGAWEVTIVDGDGRANDVTVAPDGTATVRGPESDDDALDPDLLDASVDYGAAIAVAEGTVPDATVTGMELSEDDGLPTWTVDLTDGTSLEIDASSAVVKQVEDQDG